VLFYLDRCLSSLKEYHSNREEEEEEEEEIGQCFRNTLSIEKFKWFKFQALMFMLTVTDRN